MSKAIGQWRAVISNTEDISVMMLTSIEQMVKRMLRSPSLRHNKEICSTTMITTDKLKILESRLERTIKTTWFTEVEIVEIQTRKAYIVVAEVEPNDQLKRFSSVAYLTTHAVVLYS